MKKDISRGKHNPESKAAFKKLKSSLSVMRLQVLREIAYQKKATLKTICHYMQREKNEISGRLSELKVLGLIEKTGEKHDGCAMLQLTDQGKEILTRKL